MNFLFDPTNPDTNVLKFDCAESGASFSVVISTVEMGETNSSVAFSVDDVIMGSCKSERMFNRYVKEVVGNFISTSLVNYIKKVKEDEREI